MNSTTKEIFFQLICIGLGIKKADGDILVGFRSLNTHDSAMWKSMCDMGIKQGVAAFLFDGLQTLKNTQSIPAELMPPKEVLMRLYSHTLQVEQSCNKHKVAIHNLAKFYNGHGFKMMLLKGYGLSLLYPNPAHRPCGDIDIWLYGEQEKGDKLLSKERGVVVDTDYHHHTKFVWDGVIVENHYDFINIQSHLSNRKVEKELQRLVKQEGERITVIDADVYLPPVNFNALFLLRHAAEHFAAAELALRQITDWAMFVMNYHKTIDWSWLCDFAKEQNMHKFLNCLNAICIDYLGVSQEFFPEYMRERDMELEGRVMQDMLYPPFEDKSALNGNILKNYGFRFRRWWANRWKHRMVYRDSILLTFFVQIRSHLMKSKA